MSVATSIEIRQFALAKESVRGTVPAAEALRYPRLRTTDLENAAAQGNCVNPIMLYSGNNILIWGASGGLGGFERP